MQESQETIQAVNASRKFSLAVLIFRLLLGFLLLGLSFLFTYNKYFSTIVVGSLILILEGFLIVPCIGLAWQGRSAFSKTALWVGIFIIVGGIWFDVLATVWNTPDMGREGNPFIIFMYRNGFPLWSMYLVGFYAQATLTVISVLLWVAFVRHGQMYLNTLLALQPQSFLEYLKAAFGGNTWYAKTNHLQVSRSYRFLWLPTLLRIAPFDRWALGLEWMGVLRPSYIFYLPASSWVQSIGVFLLFMLGLTVFYYKNRGQIQKFDGKFVQASYLNLLRSCLVGMGIFICGCCGLTAVSVPSALYLTRPPDGLQVVLTQSETAKVGQPFVIELDISNTGNKPFTISLFLLNQLGMPGIMEALTYVSADPPATFQTQNGLQYLITEQTFAPGETKRQTFYFVPYRSGDFTGIISIHSYERLLTLNVNLHVDP